MNKVTIRRPTTLGSNVDVFVPEHDEEKMKAVLHRVLYEARKAQGTAFFADEDVTVFVSKESKAFTRETDLDGFVAEIVKLALEK